MSNNRPWPAYFSSHHTVPAPPYKYKDAITFYKYLLTDPDFTYFDGLTLDRQEEINVLVEEKRHEYMNKSITKALERDGISLICFTAEKLRTLSIFKDFTPDEKAYFFIKMCDPNFNYTTPNLNYFEENHGQIGKIIIDYFSRLERSYLKRYPLIDSNIKR